MSNVIPTPEDDDRLPINKPDFLREEKYDLSQINKYSQPPRLKVIQSLTSPPFKPPFVDGDVILTPQLKKIGSLNEEFTFVPVYFFVNYVIWNPPQMRHSLPAIREMTFDENSLTARKARTFTQEPCKESPQHNIKYAQVLNFLVILKHEEITEFPVAMFFNRGEYKTGQILLGLLQNRDQAPPYACRFAAKAGEHVGRQGRWFGLNFRNDNQPWVDEGDYNRYKKLHDDLKTLVESREMQIDLGDEDIPEEDASKETKF